MMDNASLEIKRWEDSLVLNCLGFDRFKLEVSEKAWQNIPNSDRGHNPVEEVNPRMMEIH